MASDSDSDNDQDSPGKGRKNIRKVLKDKHVADDTKRAAIDEEERLKRIAERQKLVSKYIIFFLTPGRKSHIPTRPKNGNVAFSASV